MRGLEQALWRVSFTRSGRKPGACPDRLESLSFRHAGRGDINWELRRFEYVRPRAQASAPTPAPFSSFRSAFEKFRRGFEIFRAAFAFLRTISFYFAKFRRPARFFKGLRLNRGLDPPKLFVTRFGAVQGQNQHLNRSSSDRQPPGCVRAPTKPGWLRREGQDVLPY